MNPLCLNPIGVLQTLIFNPFYQLSPVAVALLPISLYYMIPLSIYYSIIQCFQ